MDTPTNYIYRYDSWSSHMNLEGRQLRARRWSCEKEGYEHHPHASLISAEKALQPGEGIFRMSFWKTAEALRQGVPNMPLWNEIPVLQRVRADHAFFNSFIKENDDYIPTNAWLFWKIDSHSDRQEWSNDGIPIEEIDVLDLDGKWRSFSTSELMRQASDRLPTVGFEAHSLADVFGRKRTVYAKNCVLENEGRGKTLAIVITHDPVDPYRAHNDSGFLASIVKEQLEQRLPTDVTSLRVFVLDEFRHPPREFRLYEFPVEGRAFAGTSMGALSRAFFQLTKKFRKPITLDGNFLGIAPGSTLWESIVRAARLPSTADRVGRYREILIDSLPN